MNHLPSESQSLIEGAINQLLGREYPDGHRVEFEQAAADRSRLAAALAEGGWFGLCAAEALGGGGLDALEALPVAIAAGYHSVPLPLVETLLAAQVLSALPAHHDIARALAGGRQFACFADGAARGLVVAPAGDGVTVSGQWDTVAWAPQARWLLAPASSEGLDRLLLIDLESSRAACEQRTGIDVAGTLASVRVDGEALAAAAVLDAGGIALRRTLLAAAEIEGALRKGLEMTVAYMTGRVQFGKPIGSFQALKHIAADCALVLENLRVANAYAAWAVAAGAADAGEAVLVAKAYAAEHAHHAAEDMIQLHGSIGFTWELGLHGLLRRILRLRASAGTAADCNEALVAGVEARLAAETEFGA